MKFFILFAAVCGTTLVQHAQGLTGLDQPCLVNQGCESDKCCADPWDQEDTDLGKGAYPEDLNIRISNPENCITSKHGSRYCVCKTPVIQKKKWGILIACPTPPDPPNVGVVSSQQNCRSDPCNRLCPQNNANILLAQLDRLSPTDIQGIFKRDERVSFYLGCVLGTGSCDGVGGAFKEALSDWAVSKQVCGRCNTCQKRKVSYIISQLRNNPQYKTRYDQILAQFGGSDK